MQYRTNNVPRPIVLGCELSGKQLKQAVSDYDFLGDEFDGSSFVVYRGHVHYLGNFERRVNFGVWHGIESDSAYTGTVIRLIGDGETVIMGYAISGDI